MHINLRPRRINLQNGYNPYGAASFDETYQLTDGLNIITLQAVDQVGNTVTKTFNVTKTPKLLKEESLDELEITPEQEDQTPKNDAGEAPVTTSSSDEKAEVTPSTEPTMVNPEDSKVETSNPVVEIDTSKEAQSDGNDDTATNTPASVTTAVDENPVDNSPNATTTMPNHAKGVDSDAEATEATNTKDNTPGTTAPTDTDPTMDKESPTKSEVDPTATSLPDSQVVETATETTVNEDKGNKTDDDEPTATNLTTSKDSAIQPKSDPAASLQSNDKAVEAAIENDKIAEKEGHQSANTQPAITDVTTDKDSAVKPEIDPAASSQSNDKAVEAAMEDSKAENDKGSKSDSAETNIAPTMAKNSGVKSEIDLTAIAPRDNTATSSGTAKENADVKDDKGNKTDTVESAVTDTEDDNEGTVKSEIESVATTPSSNTATATEITKENTPTEDEKDNQVNVVETTDTHPKPIKDRATKSEIESEATAPSKTEVGETVAEDAKGEHDKSNKSDDVEPTVSDRKQTKIVPLSQNQTHQQSHQTKTTSMKQPWKRLKPKTIERLQLVPLQQLPQTRRQAKIIPLSRKWTQRQSHQLITRPLKRSRKRPESKKSKAISPLIPSRLSLTQQLTKIVPLIPTSRQPQPHQLLTKRRKPQRKASMSKTPRAITPISGKHPSVTHRLAKILLLSPKLIQRQPHQVTTQPLDQRSKYSQREASKTAKSTPRKQP
jgi:hypothetical protein